MKVSVDYTSFNLRRDVECIERTEGALKFFKDHSIPHTEELIDSYMGAKENRIVWHENVMPFELNINTFEEMHSYTLKYGLIFEIRDDKTLIKF